METTFFCCVFFFSHVVFYFEIRKDKKNKQKKQKKQTKQKQNKQKRNSCPELRRNLFLWMK